MKNELMKHNQEFLLLQSKDTQEHSHNGVANCSVSTEDASTVESDACSVASNSYIEHSGSRCPEMLSASSSSQQQQRVSSLPAALALLFQPEEHDTKPKCVLIEQHSEEKIMMIR